MPNDLERIDDDLRYWDEHPEEFLWRALANRAERLGRMARMGESAVHAGTVRFPLFVLRQSLDLVIQVVEKIEENRRAANAD